MSAVMTSAYHVPETLDSHARSRLKFWGVCCDGGKAYKQVVNYRFHLTMAVLDPKTYDKNVKDRRVKLSVIQHGKVFLLCVLKHEEVQQAPLNVVFDKGDDVTFTVDGYGTVNLTGYQQIDSVDSNCDMFDKHYCPVAELKSAKKKHRLSPPMNGMHTKNKADANLKKALKEDGGSHEEEDSDEDDSDFSVSAVVNEEESSSEESEEENDEYELSDSEIKALTEDDEEVPDVTALNEFSTPLNSEEKKSQKRKHENIPLSQKRVKIELGEASPEDDESDSDEEGLNSSIGNTPMPKKEDISAKAKKKLKKKKRLSEISNIASAEKEKENSFSGGKKNKKSDKRKNPIVRLEGGVECQDVTIGKGPTAAKGKIVSIFYLGKLENQTVFDSRTAPKKPFSFKLGVPEVIRGLDEGIVGMKVGGRRKLKIPPKMGYGSKEMGNVPPNSTLFFIVELVSVN